MSKVPQCTKQYWHKKAVRQISKTILQKAHWCASLVYGKIKNLKDDKYEETSDSIHHWEGFLPKRFSQMSLYHRQCPSRHFGRFARDTCMQGQQLLLVDHPLHHFLSVTCMYTSHMVQCHVHYVYSETLLSFYL